MNIVAIYTPNPTLYIWAETILNFHILYKVPFTLKLELRATLNLHFLGVWYAELTSFHPKLKLLRAQPIFKLSTVWARVMWPCLKWDIKGEMTLQRNIHDKPKNVWKTNGMGPKKMIQTHVSNLGLWPKACQEWLRACCSCSTWDPWRCYLSVASPIISWSSQVESSSVKVDLSEQSICKRFLVSTNKKVLNLWALNISSIERRALDSHDFVMPI